MTIKEIRAAVGMTQQEFADYLGISKRTVESWEGGKRNIMDYVLDLIVYKLKNEGLLK